MILLSSLEMLFFFFSLDMVFLAPDLEFVVVIVRKMLRSIRWVINAVRTLYFPLSLVWNDKFDSEEAH